MNLIKKIFYKFGHDIKKTNQELINNLLKDKITENPIILDVGGNKGQSIKIFKKIFKNPIIHSFEPIKSEFDIMYQEFKDDVNSYLTNTTLDDVKELILISDLYIGADSFLVHLSYYLKKTYFIVFYQNNDDFLPPNANDKFYLKCNELDNFEENLKNKFKKIGLI